MFLDIGDKQVVRTYSDAAPDPLMAMEARAGCLVLVALNNLLWPVVARTSVRAFVERWVYVVEAGGRYAQ